MTQIRDTEEGLELLRVLVDAIITTWKHRVELVAVTAARRAPRWLDIWSLLPQTKRQNRAGKPRSGSQRFRCMDCGCMTIIKTIKDRHMRDKLS